MTDDERLQARVQQAVDHGRRLLDRGAQELGGVLSRGVRAVTGSSGAGATPP